MSFVTVLPVRFGLVFLWDSGSTVGEVGGHSKTINSVDLKPSRPYRLITGGDDNIVAFSEGPPFKFKFTLKVLYGRIRNSFSLLNPLADK